MRNEESKITDTKDFIAIKSLQTHTHTCARHAPTLSTQREREDHAYAHILTNNTKGNLPCSASVV